MAQAELYRRKSDGLISQAFQFDGKLNDFVYSKDFKNERVRYFLKSNGAIVYPGYWIIDGDRAIQEHYFISRYELMDSHMGKQNVQFQVGDKVCRYNAGDYTILFIKEDRVLLENEYGTWVNSHLHELSPQQKKFTFITKQVVSSENYEKAKEKVVGEILVPYRYIDDEGNSTNKSAAEKARYEVNLK